VSLSVSTGNSAQSADVPFAAPPGAVPGACALAIPLARTNATAISPIIFDIMVI
jgi:hypothetical protein